MSCGGLTGDVKNCKLFTKSIYTNQLEENKMEKVQMTEEQAIEIIKVIFNTNANSFDYAISELKKAGYIKKSELQTLVEEAEETYIEFIKSGLKSDNENYLEACAVLDKCRLLVTALKKSHPEFKK